MYNTTAHVITSLENEFSQLESDVMDLYSDLISNTEHINVEAME